MARPETQDDESYTNKPTYDTKITLVIAATLVTLLFIVSYSPTWKMVTHFFGF